MAAYQIKNEASNIIKIEASSRINNVGIKKEPNEDEWNPVIVSAAELFKTDEMSREEYLTWIVQQHGFCYSIEGDTPERSYTTEEIQAEVDRQYQQRQDEYDSQDRHHNLEFNMYQSSLCTQGTSESNKYHFGPIPDEYESYYSAPFKQTMDWDRFYEDSEKPQLINPMTKIGCGKWWMYEKDEVLPPAFKILKKRELNFLNPHGIIF